MGIDVRHRHATRAAVASAVALAGVVGPASIASAHEGFRRVAPQLLTAPVVTGQPVVDQELSTSMGSWRGSTNYSFWWERCDAVTLACSAIADAYSDTYVVTTDDIGYLLRSIVRAANPYGSSTAAAGPTTAVKGSTPPPTPPPTPTPPPAPSGRFATNINGVVRSWDVVTPATPDPSGAKSPLIVVLPASTPTTLDTPRFAAFVQSLAKAGATVAVVNPDGVWTGNESDTAFLDAVIAHGITTFNADAAPVSVAGYRDGALATGRYACVRADKLAAVSLVGIGANSDITFTTANCQPANPLPIHVMSAVDDPADIAVRFWLNKNACSGEVQQRIKATPFAVTRYESYGCAAALRYDTVASPLDEWVEEDGYSTSDQVWAFLSKFSRSA